MSRTTVDIDEPVLREVKRLGKREGRSLGKAITRLLAEALALRGRRSPSVSAFHWASRSMEPQVDLLDKDALWKLLDR
ncbi:MAG: antitoxin [Planctomycetes bacterium]|nr:antitoxin [Planctomycetota bacterium]